MAMLRRSRGFTLIELMVVLAVVAVLVTVAAPALQAFIDKNRLVGASEAIYTQVQQARSEAVKTSANVMLVFSKSAWCAGYGPESAGACDCTKAPADGGCVGTLRGPSLSGGDFKGVTMKSAPASITFDGVRGIVAASSAVQEAVGETGVLLESKLGRQLRLDIGAMGSAAVCSPAGKAVVAGYPTC